MKIKFFLKKLKINLPSCSPSFHQQLPHNHLHQKHAVPSKDLHRGTPPGTTAEEANQIHRRQRNCGEIEKGPEERRIKVVKASWFNF